MMNKKIKYKTSPPPPLTTVSLDFSLATPLVNTIISMMFLKWIEKRTGIFLEKF